ncbi:ATP-grasp domain-containing protein [Kutzneria kofuensis]|uniref:Biotin carboxylase n=1 Tax=Kutzneria kofuensis TaxID=103725 RepID=A0A7W9KQA5_9PSEU|nr:ATP-grasp domain-containing protein [Kutzneria kofuensis]MBB5896014.1 biotin carboxylase [Kutzneria kofuensis]
MDHLIVVGSGGRPYREYAFTSLAPRYRLSALLPAEPTWQRLYLDDWRVVDFADDAAVVDALRSLAGPDSGVLTWDETVLKSTARAAEKLSLRHMSAESAARCRDKYTTRTLLDAAGLPAVRYGLAHSANEAVSIAEGLGFPVVVKPRALAGSVGVVLANDAGEVWDAFGLATGAAFATLPNGHGVLVEEYLDGPEISVDSVVSDGAVTCVHVARKRLGFEPHFEEVGHLLTGWTSEPWADAVRDLVVNAHRALGVELGVTHAELRLTAAGPRLVELNGRLGGDLIPYAGFLATGIDLVVAAAELALGREPDLTPVHDRAAEVRFVYPPYDAVVHRIDLRAAADVPGIEHVAVLAETGSTLLLPPRQAIPRLAALVAVAGDEDGCRAVLDTAVPLVVSEVSGA